MWLIQRSLHCLPVLKFLISSTFLLYSWETFDQKISALFGVECKLDTYDDFSWDFLILIKILINFFFLIFNTEQFASNAHPELFPIYFYL